MFTGLRARPNSLAVRYMIVTNDPQPLSAVSFVSRIIGSSEACAASIRSNGSLCSGGSIGRLGVSNQTILVVLVTKGLLRGLKMALFPAKLAITDNAMFNNAA